MSRKNKAQQIFETMTEEKDPQKREKVVMGLLKGASLCTFTQPALEGWVLLLLSDHDPEKDSYSSILFCREGMDLELMNSKAIKALIATNKASYENLEQVVRTAITSFEGSLHA